jgi:hypothetical protein
MNAYGREHPIQREDVILGTWSTSTAFELLELSSVTVICTLDAPNYALFVSHKHPDSQVWSLPSYKSDHNLTSPVGEFQRFRNVQAWPAMGPIFSNSRSGYD